MKKVLFVITHLELGGAQKQLLSLIKKLDPDEYSLYLCAGDCGYLKEEFVNFSRLNLKLIPELTRRINPIYDFIAFAKLYFYIRRNKFDLIHTHSPKASVLGRWAAFFAGSRNIIYTVHGWPFHRFMNRLVYRLYFILEKVSSLITKKIIVVSQADFTVAVVKKVASIRKLTLIHYGVDVESFKKIYEERKNFSARETSVITVSALKAQKGLNHFLQIASCLSGELPRTKFYIIGDGPLREQLKKRIKALGLEQKVILTGWNKDVYPFYHKASLFVLTSLWEGLPVALIEAVISGIPVVITNTRGVLDIVENNKQGKVVELDDLERMPVICKDLLRNYKHWNKIVKQERENINMSYWSQARMIQETEKLYQSLN
ncbi:MAG: glycosyltransferase family 4 protein [Candidatus Omnitrophota bacterium]